MATTAAGRPASRRVRLPGPERESQLLEVAEALFAQHGIEGVSVEDIARKAGVTRPVVYHHLGSRDAAFLACLRRARRDFQDGLCSRLSASDRDLEACVQAGGEQFFDFLEKSPRRWVLMVTNTASLDGLVAEEIARLRSQTIDLIADAVRSLAPGVDDAQLMSFVYATSGIAEQFGRWWLREPLMSKEWLLTQWSRSILSLAQGTLDVVHPPHFR